MKPGLHLVATPIGHLGDLSPRALETLKRTPIWVLCEDSRVTGKLLHANGIQRSLHPYHEHNAARMRPRVLDHLAKGEAVALASDAGTPLVSDPGYKLVRDVIEAGYEVLAVPGPSAALAAPRRFQGLPTDRFLMAGFLPNKLSARRRAIEELKAVPASLIWFESARRLAGALADLDACLGPRPAAVARELTKVYEEVRRGLLPDLAAAYAEKEPPRGEIVIVVGPPAEAEITDETLDAALTEALETLSPSAAAGRGRRAKRDARGVTSIAGPLHFATTGRPDAE